MVRKKSRGRPTKEQTEHFEPRTLDSKDLLRHVKLKKTTKSSQTLDDNDQHLFIKLLEAINMRAAHIAQAHPAFPQMNLSALYCTGVIIQEYVRYLGSDILQQKQALEGRPALSTLFSEAELDAQSVKGIIQANKPTRSIPAPPIETRPNVEEEAGALERQKRARSSYQTDIVTQTNKYEELLKDPEWKGVLRRKRDPEADAKAAALRREMSRKKRQEELQKKERQEELQKKMNLPTQPIPQTQPLPPKQKTNHHDMFDIASYRKRTNHHSCDQKSSKRKRIKLESGF